MEGISGEAASLAGHLKLSNLCWIYDNNKISIEGSTDWAFSDDTATRFIGYGWNVTRVGDANDLDMLRRALNVFKKTQDRPTLIIVDSHIAYGAPTKQDTGAAHGEPLGEEEIRLTKRFYDWPEDAKFLVPDGVRERLRDGFGKRGRDLHAAWLSRYEAYRQQHADLADHLHRMQYRQLPDGWDRDLPTFPDDPKGHGRPRRVGQGAECDREEPALADRRRGRPGALHQDPAHLRGRGRPDTGQSRRPKHALRCSGARDGRGGERPVALQGARIRRRIPHLQ